jgi:hypothetical protein
MIKPDHIRKQIEDYLNGCVSATDLISYIDTAVGDDDVYSYEQNICDIIMKYQDLLALYVEDPVKRQESASYYGPDRLKAIVDELRQELACCDLK